MGHLFYFIGLIITLLNIFMISKFKKIFTLKEWMVKFKEISKRVPIDSDYRSPEDKDILNTWSLSSVLTALWVFFGLITNSWYVFLSLMIFNTIINILSKLSGEFSQISFILFFLKTLIITATIGFLVINHFHLHWDIWSLIVSKF